MTEEKGQFAPKDRYKLVPLEPTYEMENAACEAADNGKFSGEYLRNIWTAMLAAAGDPEWAGEFYEGYAHGITAADKAARSEIGTTEFNLREYERILGPRSFQEVADELAKWNKDYAGWCVRMVGHGIKSFGWLHEAIDALAKERDDLKHDIERQVAIASEHATDAERYKDALIRIINGVPACTEDGGMHVDHFGPNGEFLGTEQVDPQAVISCILGVAHSVLESPTAAARKEQA